MPTKTRKYKVPKVKFSKYHCDYVDISRYSSSSVNEFGEPILTWSTLYTNVQCEIYPAGVATGKDMMLADLATVGTPGTLAVYSHVVYFLTGTDVKIRDRILDADGNTYDVVRVQPWDSHIEAMINISEKI